MTNEQYLAAYKEAGQLLLALVRGEQPALPLGTHEHGRQVLRQAVRIAGLVIGVLNGEAVLVRTLERLCLMPPEDGKEPSS